jgi:hypothetical protein
LPPVARPEDGEATLAARRRPGRHLQRQSAEGEDDPEPAIILLIWTEDSQMAQSRQNTVEVGEGVSHSLSKQPRKRLRIQRLSQILIVQHPALLIAPIAREILARISEVVASFYPHFFALQRALELLKHAQFVVAAIDLRFAVDLFEYFSFQRDVTTPSTIFCYGTAKGSRPS